MKTRWLHPARAVPRPILNHCGRHGENVGSGANIQPVGRQYEMNDHGATERLAANSPAYESVIAGPVAVATSARHLRNGQKG